MTVRAHKVFAEAVPIDDRIEDNGRGSDGGAVAQRRWQVAGGTRGGAKENGVQIVEKTYGPVTVLAPAGRIDLTSGEAFQAAVLAAVHRHEPAGALVVLDFSGVEYISSIGLRALMVAAKQTKALGGQLAIAALTPVVHEIFHISRFDLVLKAFASLREALAALSPEAAAQFDDAAER
jgi:anti-anti-sigma factor